MALYQEIGSHLSGIMFRIKLNNSVFFGGKLHEYDNQVILVIVAVV